MKTKKELDDIFAKVSKSLTKPNKQFNSTKSRISNIIIDIEQDITLNSMDEIIYQSFVQYNEEIQDEINITINSFKERFRYHTKDKQDNTYLNGRLYASTENKKKALRGKGFELVVCYILGKLNVKIEPNVRNFNGDEVDIIMRSNPPIYLQLKTCFRERWKIDIESFTHGCIPCFVTLDEELNDNIFLEMRKRNITVVCPSKIKINYYPVQQCVMSFKDLLERYQRLKI